jgi:two-component system, NtrC family, sensor kinase
MSTVFNCGIVAFFLGRFVIKYLDMPKNFGSKYDIVNILWLPCLFIGLFVHLLSLDLLGDYITVIPFIFITALFFSERENKYAKNIFFLTVPYVVTVSLDIINFYIQYFRTGKTTDQDFLSGFGILWALGFGLYIQKQGKKWREEEERLLKVNQELELKNTSLASIVDDRAKEISIRNQELELKIQELKATQEQLIQSEKMASLGELTAGIAHEIQNPLNFVNNFADVTNELISELGEELENETVDKANIKDILKDISNNLEKIVHHGKRADGIVKGMLQHSRKGSGEKELIDINDLADEYLRLAFHGLRAKDKSFNSKMETELNPFLDKIAVFPQEIGRVLLNLITNAFHAVQERKNNQTENKSYDPIVKVKSFKSGPKLINIVIEDNGTGIPKDKLDKIFQPFFTTKPTGQGTGLGLSIAYDIVVKMHGGKLDVESQEGVGTKFIIELPIS